MFDGRVRVGANRCPNYRRLAARLVRIVGRVSADGSQVAVGTSGYSQTGDAGGYVRVVGWDGARWVPKGLDLLLRPPPAMGSGGASPWQLTGTGS